LQSVSSKRKEAKNSLSYRYINISSDKASEAAKKSLEALSNYPPDENLATSIVQAASKGTYQGIEVISISDVKKGKLEETRCVITHYEYS
jgi:hypothetical protein